MEMDGRDIDDTAVRPNGLPIVSSWRVVLVPPRLPHSRTFSHQLFPRVATLPDPEQPDLPSRYGHAENVPFLFRTGDTGQHKGFARRHSSR